jgi:hypothetical protein
MEESPSWKANRLSWSRNSLHFMEPKHSLLCSHDPTKCWASSIQFMPPLLPPANAKVFQVVSFPQVVPPKSCMHLSPAPYIHMPCPSHPHLHLITLITFSEKYKTRHSSLGSLVQYPVTHSPTGPNIFLSILLLNKLNLCSSLMRETKWGSVGPRRTRKN